MGSGTNLSGNAEKLTRKESSGGAAKEERSRRRDINTDCNRQVAQRRRIGTGECTGDLPERVRASVEMRRGEYDARRLRSQREVIRDVMLAAADCDTWLTLGELRALTRYGEASISAQLRHLRKLENGGYEVAKRRREDAPPARQGADGRGECVWEYRVARTLRPGPHTGSSVSQELSTTS
jgi:hypothetical protein